MRMQRLALLLKEGAPVCRSCSPVGYVAATPTDPGKASMQQQQMQAPTGAVHMGRLHLCGQACRFSPFAVDLLAVATSQLFGMAGPGALEVFRLQRAPQSPPIGLPAGDPGPPSAPFPADLQAPPASVLQPLRVAFLQHQQAINDVAWSELSAQTLVGGGEGGSLLTWRLSDPQTAEPRVSAGQNIGGVFVGELKGHTRDAVSLSWSCVDKRLLASAALDGQVRVWDMQQGSTLRVLQHTAKAAACSCSTSPVDASLVASVGADGRLAVHDLRGPAAGGEGPRGPSWGLTAHPCEALCLDWMKHRPWQLLTGAADGTIALWDLRRGTSGVADAAEAARCCVSTTQAHQLAVRRVASHPFKAQRFATCSYDMQVKVWDSDEGPSISLPAKPEVATPTTAAGVPSPFVGGSGWVRLQGCFDQHREFILGLDWSTFSCGLLASASWDRSVCVWNADTGPSPPPVPKRPLYLSMKTPT